MSIEQLLKRPVETVSTDASCGDAARRMRDCRIGAVVVEEDGRPVGMLTDRDVAVRVVAAKLDPERTPVRDVMSRDTVFLSRDRSLAEVISTMSDLAIRRVPIVDSNGLLAGLVSMDDLMLLLAEQLGSLGKAIEKEIARPSE